MADMLRKNIVKQLREVSDVARCIEDCHIGNSVTGERIDFDAAFVSERSRTRLCWSMAA